MNRYEILNYAILGLVAGVFGYVIYLYFVVPYICANNPYQSVQDQCKTFDTSARLQYAVPFIIAEIILLLVKIKYKPEEPITSGE